MSQAAAPKIVCIYDCQVVKNGRSLSVTLRNHVSKAMGLKPGDPVRIAVRDDGVHVLVFMETEMTSNGGSTTMPRPIHLAMEDPTKPLLVIPEGRRVRAKTSFIRSLNARDQRQFKFAQ